MARIPTIVANESPRAGAPSSAASGDAFGANIGRAVQQIGGVFQQVGSDIASIGQERAAQARQLAVANAYGNASWAKDYNDLAINYPDPTGAEFTGTVDSAYSSWMDDTLANSGLTGKALDDLHIRLLNDKRAYLARAAGDQANMALGNAKNSSATGLDTLINDVRANGMTAPEQYAVQLTKGLEIINNQPGYDTTAKEASKTLFRSQLATARFSALVDAQTTGIGIEGVRKELASDEWKSQFDAQLYNQMVNALDSAKTSIETGQRALITGTLESLGARAGNVPIPEGEMAAARKTIDEAGVNLTPAQAYKWADIQTKDGEVKWAIGKTPAEIEQRKHDIANNVYNRTPSTDFLFSRVLGISEERITNLDPRMQTNLANMLQSAPPEIRDNIFISSGYRTYGEQVKIRTRSDHGRKFAAAPAGYSQHQFGRATDLTFKTAAAREWAHAHAGEFGLAFPYGNDPVHIQLIGATKEPKGPEAALAYERSHGAVGGASWTGGAGAGLNVPGSVRPIFDRVTSAYSLPNGILGAMWRQESGGVLSPSDSSAGAQGPMQFMPATWARYGKGGDVHNIDQAVDAAGRYMQDLMKMFHGDVRLALAAYNWGEGNVRDWIKEDNADPNAMPKETREYVEKVLGYAGTGAWAATADMPGTTGPGVTDAGYAQITTLTSIASEQQTRLHNSMMDYAMSPEAGGMALSDINTPEGMAQRATDMHTIANKYNVAPGDVRPFTTDEANRLSALMASGDDNAAMAVLSAIAAVKDKGFQDAALAQVGEKNPVYAEAGRERADGNPNAMNVLQGQKIIDNYTTKPEWLTHSQETFDQAVGTSLAGIAPKDRAAIKGAIDATYAQMTNYMPGDGSLDDPTYAAAVEAVLGVNAEDVNGQPTILPKGLDGATVERAIDRMTVADWTSMSESGLAPTDKLRRPLEQWALQGANLFSVGENYYRVAIDGGLALTADGNAFLLKLDEVKIKQLATAEAAAPTTEEGQVLNPAGEEIDRIGIGVPEPAPGTGQPPLEATSPPSPPPPPSPAALQPAPSPITNDPVLSYREKRLQEYRDIINATDLDDSTKEQLIRDYEQGLGVGNQ